MSRSIHFVIVSIAVMGFAPITSALAWKGAPTFVSAPAGLAESTVDGGEALCGDGSTEPCPLRAWMKGNAAPAMSVRDYRALAVALDQLAGLSPPGYKLWASIARDGANAARVEDLEATRAACRTCHAEYRDRYKKELRDRPL